MKTIIALVLIGLVAVTCAYPGLISYGALPYSAGIGIQQIQLQAPLAIPYAITQQSYNTLASNYQLKLDTSLPGSAYTSAAPTAYGYEVVKAI